VLPAGASAEVGREPTTTAMLLLLLVRRVSGAMMVHRSVPRGSATGRSCHIHPFICLHVGADRIVRDDDIVLL
jgi:hypothetical protein